MDWLEGEEGRENMLSDPKGLPLYQRAKIGILDRQVGFTGYRVAVGRGANFT